MNEDGSVEVVVVVVVVVVAVVVDVYLGEDDEPACLLHVEVVGPQVGIRTQGPVHTGYIYRTLSLYTQDIPYTVQKLIQISEM